MPVKLGKNHVDFDGDPITRKQVEKMVDEYRQNRVMDDYSLNFAHFSAIEILDLFVANGVITGFTPAQLPQFPQFGMKVYMANHGQYKDTVPADKPNYLGYDTVIICNTTLTDADGVWVDMLTNGKDSVTVVGAGDGVDKGTICPPDCPPPAGTDEQQYDIEDQAQ